MRIVSADRWRQLEPLVDHLLDTPAGERDAAVDAAAGDDAELRDELAQLVAGCSLEHRLLDRPAPERFAALLDDDALTVPAPPLVERYGISRVLGRGGMATVYLGRDMRHGRDVAVKVMRPFLAGPAGHARFLHEIGITARLRHPNIVPVFDSGESDGLLYYVMPYEEGHSLRERIEREGALPVDDVIVILRDLCEALGHAHAHGIVHLDVKPDNILLSGRHAMVADFGVARALGAATGGQRAGSAAGIGTPAYMAPEQLATDRPLDHRADLYALGIVAWESLTGHPPPAAGSPALHRTLATPSLVTQCPDVPPPLADLVARCLARDPDARWASAADVLARLDEVQGARARMVPERGRGVARAWRLTMVAAGTVGLVAGGLWLSRRPSPDGPATSAGSVARGAPSTRQLFLVADIENRTGDRRVGQLVTELVRRELAAVPHLAHVSREDIVTTLRLMRRDSSTLLDAAVVRDVAERLDVPMIVEGSVWSAGPALVLSAQITETRSGTVTHGARAVARDSTELVAAVDSLIRGLGPGVGEPFAPPQTRFIRSATTPSAAALEELRLGVDERRLGNYLGAVARHTQATRLDPAFASAWVAVVSNRGMAGLPTLPALPALDRVRARLDPLFPTEAMLVEWFHLLHVQGDQPRAIAAMQRYVDALLRLRGREQGFTNDVAIVLARAGDLRAGERLIREADSVFGWSPQSHRAALVSNLHAQGRVREAREVLDRLLAEGPDHSGGLRLRAELLADEGRWGEAHDAAARIPRNNTLLNDLRVQGEMDAVRGRLGEGARHWQQLAEQALALGEVSAAVDIAASAAWLRLARGEPEARSEFSSFVARTGIDSLAPHLRPYLPLALFWARAGDAGRARHWLARYDREFPVAFRGPDLGFRHRVRAAIAVVEGKHRTALVELRAAAALPRLRTTLIDDPDLPLDAHPELARAWDAIGGSDSAIVVYERYFAARSLGRTAVDAFERGPSHEHLAALLERQGDRARAAAQHAALAALWRDAEAPLRLRADLARERAMRLRRPPGG